MFGEQTGYGTGHWSIFGEKRLKLRASGVSLWRQLLYGQFYTKKRKEENKLIVYFYKIEAKKKIKIF